jgi:SprT protein
MKKPSSLLQFDFLNPLFTSEPADEALIDIAPSADVGSQPPETPSPLPTIEELRELAKTLLHSVGATALAARMIVRWNPRLRNTAGMAFPGRGLITLNPILSQFGAEEIDRTLRHELAHLLAQDRAGRRRIDPHGKEWKLACRDLGLADEKRTHDLPLPRHKQRPRHFYRCPGCGFELQRVKPLRKQSACAVCCRAHSRGRFDVRFRFVRTSPPAATADH